MHFPAEEKRGDTTNLQRGQRHITSANTSDLRTPFPLIIHSTSVSFISLQTAADGLYECSLGRKDGEGKTATCASRQATDDPPSSFMAVNYREEELHGRA